MLDSIRRIHNTINVISSSAQVPVPPLQRQTDRKLEITKCVWGVISPLLANVYLDPLDQEMERRGRVMVRYADDFVILCRSEKEAQETLEEVRQWVETNG